MDSQTQLSIMHVFASYLAIIEHGNVILTALF